MKFDLNGEMPDYLLAKDIILQIIGDIGVAGATYRSMEFGGDAISQVSIWEVGGHHHCGLKGALTWSCPSRILQLSMEERQTLCNMAIEAGGKNGIIPADEVTTRFVDARNAGKRPYTVSLSDHTPCLLLLLLGVREVSAGSELISLRCFRFSKLTLTPSTIPSTPMTWRPWSPWWLSPTPPTTVTSPATAVTSRLTVSTSVHALVRLRADSMGGVVAVLPRLSFVFETTQQEARLRISLRRHVSLSLTRYKSPHSSSPPLAR